MGTILRRIVEWSGLFYDIPRNSPPPDLRVFLARPSSDMLRGTSFLDMRFAYAPRATPIDLDEAAGLIPTHRTLQRELNEYEANRQGGNL
jgi:hypothetical protein